MIKVIPCRSPNADVLNRCEMLERNFGLSRGSRRVDEVVLVVTKQGLALKLKDRLLTWHPGLLHALRESGERHPWVRLGKLKRGDRVLDCSLGLGTDARFISEITEEEVVGLESSLSIFLMTLEALSKVNANVNVQHVDSVAFLSAQPSDSFDVVIADPMFPKHLEKASHSLELVRVLANFESIDTEWLNEARRVASRCVLIKDHRRNNLLERLGAEVIWARGKRHTRYGKWKATSLI
jgi:16S rRNA (guanine1516-N2)-methyltransferase